MLRLLIFALIMMQLVCSCKEKKAPQKQLKGKEKEMVFTLSSPKSGETFTNKDNILIEFNSEKGVKPDSCILLVDGNRVGISNTNSFILNPSNLKMGVRRIAMQIYTNKESETLPFAIKIKPHNAPKLYTYKVVKEYPHDTKAYTQGLFFKDGYLYESTGEHGKSSLRKVDLTTGKVLKKIDLEKEYFGEGICMYNNKILQLTWQNKKGFVYNFDNFTQESVFTYTGEGWGIESSGDSLWITDGSSNLYRMNPDMSIAEQLEVQTDKETVPYLNELEYIKGELWANVYTQNYIVTIKPKTGEVTSIINLAGILDKSLYTDNTDVLNGIAYDKVNDRIFITGKNWPKLFEIKLVAK